MVQKKRSSASGPTSAIKYDPVTLSFGSVATVSTDTATASVTGLKTTDVVTVNAQNLPANLGVVDARVSAADTLEVRLMNPTAGGIVADNIIFDLVAHTFTA
jgi:hypothetical protein